MIIIDYGGLKATRSHFPLYKSFSLPDHYGREPECPEETHTEGLARQESIYNQI